jgi:arginine/lysine/histidine/glutamine transport system ATP-binding protein
MEPQIMLFDEPTSALDPELVGEVLEVMQQLADKGMTMVVVTHEIQFARDVANRVLFLDQGLIVEEGPAREVLTNPQSDRLHTFLRRMRQA